MKLPLFYLSSGFNFGINSFKWEVNEIISVFNVIFPSLDEYKRTFLGIGIFDFCQKYVSQRTRPVQKRTGF